MECLNEIYTLISVGILINSLVNEIYAYFVNIPEPCNITFMQWHFRLIRGVKVLHKYLFISGMMNWHSITADHVIK